MLMSVSGGLLGAEGEAKGVRLRGTWKLRRVSNRLSGSLTGATLPNCYSLFTPGRVLPTPPSAVEGLVAVHLGGRHSLVSVGLVKINKVFVLADPSTAGRVRVPCSGQGDGFWACFSDKATPTEVPKTLVTGQG